MFHFYKGWFMDDVSGNAASLFTSQVQELVAIGAAIAANCEPCFKFHYSKARKLEVSNEELSKAVEIATMVKTASVQNISDLAEKYLNQVDQSENNLAVSNNCCS